MGFLDSNFFSLQTKVVHFFAHGPTYGIWPMLVKLVLHLQQLEKSFEMFEIYHGWPSYSKWKIVTNCNYFFFFTMSPFANCTTIISCPLEVCNFSFHMIVVPKTDCPTRSFGLPLLHFLISKCLIWEYSFGTKSFSLPSMLEHILHLF
jgi:hypothetical protein